MKKAVSLKKASVSGFKSIFTVLIALLFIFSVLFFDVPTAHGEGTNKLPAKNGFEDFQEKQMSRLRGKEYSDGEVIVKFKKTETQTQMQNTLNFFKSGIEEDLEADNLMLADVPDGETVESFIEELGKQENIEYAQPNFIYRLEQTVNDQYESYQWYLDKIDVHEAWDETMGSSGVTVAVLDSGVDLDHPDIDGQVDLYHKVVAGDNSIDDDNGHGTHVSGIIAAATNNSIGVAGIAPGTSLIVVDVFTTQYNTEESEWEWGASTADVIAGISYARANGADIINMSLGSYNYDAAFEAAINAAVGAGVVCIASAGNDGDDPALREANHYPSDYANCISVISTDPNDAKSGFSNYGPQKDISAPGGSSSDIPAEWILSTYIDIERNAAGTIIREEPGYWYSKGTSMASPVVAGVAALMLAANPDLTVAQVKDILHDTAVDLGTPGRDDYFGYGRVDAQAAVLAAIAAIQVDVTGVTLNKTAVDLTVGNTETLIETIIPANATNKSVTWSGSNEFATVENGVVTAVATGSATITVTTDDGSFTDTCEVTVTNPVISVSLDKSTMGLEFGASGTLAATVYPANADNTNISWDSSDTGVATVDASGNVDAVDYGTTIIKVTTQDGGHTATCEVTVIKHVDGVTLNKNTITMYTGDEQTLIAAVSPSDASYKSVSWSSNNTGVATVDSSGKVAAVGKGTATITVTTDDGSFTDTCVVTADYGDIRSDVYTVDQPNSMLKGIALNISAAALKANLKNDSANIKIYDIAGNEYTGDKIKTGMSVKFIVDSIIKDELKIVILGDSSGDGNISITDYTLVRLDILELKSLSGEFWQASDINKDGKISITDYTLIRLHILDLKSIH